MRLFLGALSMLFISVSPAMACKTPDVPPVTFARAAKTYDACTAVYLVFPKRLEMLEALAPRLIIRSENGFVLVVDLYTRQSQSQEGAQTAYACLSEEALRKAKILVQYMNFTPEASTAWDCMQTVELDQLDKLLAASDKAKAKN